MVVHAFLWVLIGVIIATVIGAEERIIRVKEYSRVDFPPGFVFGSGTSAYQVEGAAFEDGRTPTIFDTVAHARDQGTGDVACDEYHKYKEDVQLMVETELDAYRFSISWARLIPNGRGPVNLKGLEYYNNLINKLISNGQVHGPTTFWIQPHVTLMHIDLPQALEDEYGGWIDRRVIEDFTAYADVCFREFGDRVQYWVPINEPNIFAVGGYDRGECPPLRCSSPFGLVNCSRGNSTTEPYIAAHNMLLAHASVVRLYKRKYQAKQGGFIGFNVYATDFAPLTNVKEDVIAAQRAYDFFLGWFINPLTYGGYPSIMKRNVGKRLPEFTKYESELVKGSFDFIGVNYYFGMRVKDNPSSLKMELRDFGGDMAVTLILGREGAPPGALPIQPRGLVRVLEHFKQEYGNPPIYIHENGQRTDHDSSLNDTSRVEYIQQHIGALLDAVRNGSNARGYFAWSFLDLFELLDGYKSSYGLYYVDFDDLNLTRYPKLSQRWYSDFLKGKRVIANGAPESANLDLDSVKSS